MLKRKLVQKGLGGGLLLTIAMINTAGVPLLSPNKKLNTDSTAQRISFDPVQLKVVGLSEEEAAAFPAITLNKNVEKYAADYIALYTRTFEKIKTGNSSYFTIMDTVFTRHDLPVELKYLAVVESQLKTHVVSHAGAVGAWQLMPATARTFSLKVTAGYDERKNFKKSTVAVAKYLRYLHNMFDDWLLVIAAYNGGPGTVFKAIKKSGSRNFWKLQDYLPAETRMHVKKFISTHYYFEGKGSIATLTKDEAKLYAQRMMAFVEKQNALDEEKQNESDEDTSKPAMDVQVALTKNEK